ncbi:unnamed protein product [Pleuronectes platessa]|uniref:Secreted protein n=1 Tax=Pleuronectes platessa TaxID=8262 RepID=A0A9N7ULY0_PLEPL|nr:unnamed protein product [Pleuronectes platessa]
MDDCCFQRYLRLTRGHLLISCLLVFFHSPVSAPLCQSATPPHQANSPHLVFPRTDHLLSIPDLPASSLPWILPQPSVFDHEFRLFPPGYAPARLCGYTAHHWTCLPVR